LVSMDPSPSLYLSLSLPPSYSLSRNRVSVRCYSYIDVFEYTFYTLLVL